MKDKPYWKPQQFLESGEWPFGRTGLYDALNNNKIPNIRIGRSFVIPKEAWRRYLATCGQSVTSDRSAWEDPGHAEMLRSF